MLIRFSTLLRIQDRAKRGGDIYIYIYWGDTAHTLLRWGHRTYLFGVGTPHIPYRGRDTEQHLKKKLSSGWGWVAPSCKLNLARFSA